MAINQRDMITNDYRPLRLAFNDTMDESTLLAYYGMSQDTLLEVRASS
jgi:hypothetical protein